MGDCPPCHDEDSLGSPWCHGNQLNTQLSFTDSDLKLPQGKFISCWLRQIPSVMTTSSEKCRYIKTLLDQGLSGRPVKGHSHWWWMCTAASCLSCVYRSGRFNGQNKASREDVPVLTVIFFFFIIEAVKIFMLIWFKVVFWGRCLQCLDSNDSGWVSCCFRKKQGLEKEVEPMHLMWGKPTEMERTHHPDVFQLGQLDLLVYVNLLLRLDWKLEDHVFAQRYIRLSPQEWKCLSTQLQTFSIQKRRFKHSSGKN